jgi:hypothetical protein
VGVIIKLLGDKFGSSTTDSHMNDIGDHILNRLIQIFKLQAVSQDSYKAIIVLENLLEIFKHDGSIEKRDKIFDRLLNNLIVNSKGDICWLEYDQPLLIGFKEYYRINSCERCFAK